jgi:hypothetical protein
MKRGLIVMVGVMAMLVAGAHLTLQAQGAQASKAKTMQLTGCLAKGADANSYVLNNATPVAAAAAKEEAKGKAAAKSYHVTPAASVKLEGHVGHRVELTVEEAAAGAKAGTAGTTGKSDAMQHVTVTAMKHVAPKCE